MLCHLTIWHLAVESGYHRSSWLLRRTLHPLLLLLLLQLACFTVRHAVAVLHIRVWLPLAHPVILPDTRLLRFQLLLKQELLLLLLFLLFLSLLLLEHLLLLEQLLLLQPVLLRGLLRVGQLRHGLLWHEGLRRCLHSWLGLPFCRSSTTAGGL